MCRLFSLKCTRRPHFLSCHVSSTVLHWPQISWWPLKGWPATCLVRWMSSSSSFSGVLTGLKALSMFPGALRWWTSIRFLRRLVHILRALVLGDCLWGSINITSSLLSANSRRNTPEREWEVKVSVRVGIWFSFLFHLHLVNGLTISSGKISCNLTWVTWLKLNHNQMNHYDFCQLYTIIKINMPKHFPLPFPILCSSFTFKHPTS